MKKLSELDDRELKTLRIMAEALVLKTTVKEQEAEIKKLKMIIERLEANNETT